MFACIVSDHVASARLRTPQSNILSALDPFGVSDKTGSFIGEKVQMHQSVTYNTPESLAECAPTVCTESGLIIACWARIDNRSNLAKKLVIGSAELKCLTDPQMILASYRKWGQDCVNHLAGDYSFVIYEPNSGQVFAARDPLGVKPFYYLHAGDDLILSSGARVFFAIDGLQMTPDPQWMARYVVGVSESFTDTPWLEVKKLAPGHTLSYRDNSIRLNKYLELIDDAPDVFERSDDCVQHYSEVLEAVNLCRLRSQYAVGSETSGGLDSSTVTAYAARELGRTKADFHTFGYAFCEDEPEYILETSRYYGVTNNHILTGMGTGEQLQEARRRALVLLGYPEEHANGSSHDPFYRLCEQFGVRTLLSGFGGDEVVTNPGHLLLLELIDRNKYWTLYQNLPGSSWAKPLRFARALARSRYRQSSGSEMSKIYASRWEGYAVNPDLAKRYAIREHYIGSAAYDAPFRSINQFILGERIAPYVATRLETCTLIAAGRRIEYRWPLLDHRLLQAYLSTPSIEKYGGGFGRFLHRRAMVGLVPDKITWKPGKEMGQTVLPHGYDSRSAGGELSRLYSELLNELHPVLEGVIDTDKLTAQLPMMEQLDRVKDLARWMPLYLQQIQIRNLNDWLRHYYS